MSEPISDEVRMLQQVEVVKQSLETLNVLLGQVVVQFQPPIAERRLDESIYYLLMNAVDGIGYALNAINNVRAIMQESFDQETFDE